MSKRERCPLCPHDVSDHAVCGCCRLCACTGTCNARHFGWHAMVYRGA